MTDQQWLETCATAGEFLYGFYPVSVLKRMAERKKGFTISRKKLIEALEDSDSVLMEYDDSTLLDFGNYGDGFFAPVEAEGTSLEPMLKKAQKAGNPYAALHLDDDERIDLIVSQEDVDFYIPTEQEITELVENGYIRTKAMTELEEIIRKEGGDPSFLTTLWALISTDTIDYMEAIQQIMDHLKGQSLDELNAKLAYVNNFINNINLRARRGWRPEELHRKMGGLKGMPTLVPGSARAAEIMKEAEPELRAMGANVDYSTIDSFTTTGAYGERKVIKIGRNDPCPCGSGKKYKKCHGR